MSNVNKINDTDLEGLGVTALPDVPAMSTTDLKRKFEEIMRDVVIPKVNEAIDQLNELDERTESLDPDALISAISQGVSENLIENGTFIAEESDPTVPEWAKSSSKPVYTAAEVGADPAGAADSAVYAHTLGNTSHPDIRLTLSALSTNKADAVLLSAHTDNSSIHVTQTQKNTWDAKQNAIPSNTYDAYGAASSAVSTHNSSNTAHADLRLLISGLTARLDALTESGDDTLEQIAELVQFIEDNRDIIEGVTTGKVNVSDIVNNLTTSATDKPLSAAQGAALKGLIDTLSAAFSLHTTDSDIHVTATDKAAWNAKQTAIPSNTYDAYGTAANAVSVHNSSAGAHSEQFAQKYTKPGTGIPKTDLASAVQTSLNNADSAKQTADTHVANSGIHVTAAEKAVWNAKSNFSGSYNDLTNRPTALTVDSALSNSSESPVQNKVITEALGDVSGMICDAWSASKAYAVGDYCIYNNTLWKCKIQHSGQTPAEGTYWGLCSIASEISLIGQTVLLLDTTSVTTTITNYTLNDAYAKYRYIYFEMEMNFSSVSDVYLYTTTIITSTIRTDYVYRLFREANSAAGAEGSALIKFVSGNTVSLYKVANVYNGCRRIRIFGIK